MINIIKLPPDDWELYKEYRLVASEQDPLAWGLTHEEELQYPDDWWKEQLDKASKENDTWIYFAKADHQLVGMVAANRVKKIRMNHIAHIHSVSVKKEFRGQGIAGKLMEVLLNKIEQQPDLVMAQMGVASSQTGAIALYQKMGFEIVGTRKKVFKYDKEFYDEILMEKPTHTLV